MPVTQFEPGDRIAGEVLQVSQGDEHAREYIRGMCHGIELMLKSLPDDTLRLSEFYNRVGAIGDAEPSLLGGDLSNLKADLEALIDELKAVDMLTPERYEQFLRKRAE